MVLNSGLRHGGGGYMGGDVGEKRGYGGMIMAVVVQREGQRGKREGMMVEGDAE